MLCFYCVFIIFTFYLLVHLSLLSFYCFYGFKLLFTFLALLSKHFVNSVFNKYYINKVYYCYYLSRFGAADCQRSAVLLWLQLWGQTPLIWENWIWARNNDLQDSAVKELLDLKQSSTCRLETLRSVDSWSQSTLLSSVCYATQSVSQDRSRVCATKQDLWLSG